MHAPLSSTVTLVMEILIGVLIFTIILRAYRKNVFSEKIAVFAIAYEVVFNVGYMAWRAASKPQVFGLSPALKTIAAFHGILSLAMLIAVIFFFARAVKYSRRGANFFRERRATTFLFLFFWLISLSSGIYLYCKVYF